jgi:glutamyl/glutaminyl-tRNA synthetase
MAPMGYYLQEAEDLYYWAQADRATLRATGLDWDLVEQLPQRIAATRYAQSLWNASRFNRTDSLKQYILLLPEAYNQRSELERHMRFAFQNEPKILESMPWTTEDLVDTQLIDNLRALCAYANEHRKLLTRIGVNPETIHKTEHLTERLEGLLENANKQSPEALTAKAMRDAAYSYLRLAVEEIRRHGQYAFYGDQERAEGYTSAYSHSFRRNSEPPLFPGAL